jgi:hypothetical protein
MSLAVAQEQFDLSSPLKKSALMLREPQHERGSPCTARCSAHPEPFDLLRTGLSKGEWNTFFNGLFVLGNSVEKRM